MKKYIVLFLFAVIFTGITQAQQKALPMAKTELKEELSMSEVSGNSQSDVYRYYAKGESQPYTGILFAKYDNGNYESWQEYKDGIGQGLWINYYENGNYKEIGNYEENRVEGPIKKYHPNGQLAVEGTYKDWRIWVGEWKFYDEKGQLVSTENYGTKGDFQEVEAYYQRGDIPYNWYQQIISQKE